MGATLEELSWRWVGDGSGDRRARVGHSEANRYRCRETRCTIVSVTRSLWQYTPATTIRLVISSFGDAYYSAHDLLRLLCIHPDTESTSKVQVPWFLLKMIVPRSQGQNIFARTSFTALHYGLCVQMWKKARSCGCPRWPTAPDAVVSPSLTSPSCTDIDLDTDTDTH